jgi:hypothetical protein
MNTGNLYASTQFGKTPDIIGLLLWKVVTSASRCCVFRQLPHPGIACPTGKSPRVALLATRLDVQKRHAGWHEILEPIQGDSTRPVSIGKIFRWPRRANQRHNSRHPVPPGA